MDARWAITNFGFIILSAHTELAGFWENRDKAFGFFNLVLSVTLREKNSQRNAH